MNASVMSQPIPQTAPEYDSTRVIGRPNGFFWEVTHGREYGPFASLLEALLDMQASEEAAIEPGETLEEAESEIGIAPYIDPDTGAPAEEERPRLEEH